MLLDLVAPNQLEEKYGGTAKNKEEGEFWPVNLPDQDFGVDQNQTAKTYEDNLGDQNQEDDDEFKDCE
tara:strand:- start:22 stop:225 length:204 start_codon:yes stop_codon:yes gene_type:complete